MAPIADRRIAQIQPNENYTQGFLRYYCDRRAIDRNRRSRIDFPPWQIALWGATLVIRMHVQRGESLRDSGGLEELHTGRVRARSGDRLVGGHGGFPKPFLRRRRAVSTRPGVRCSPGAFCPTKTSAKVAQVTIWVTDGKR